MEVVLHSLSPTIDNIPTLEPDFPLARLELVLLPVYLDPHSNISDWEEWNLPSRSHDIRLSQPPQPRIELRSCITKISLNSLDLRFPFLAHRRESFASDSHSSWMEDYWP